jgi:hypothetical protein
LNFNLRVDHAVNRSHTLRGSFQQTGGEQRNLGVGNYDLADRGYSRTASESLFRLSEGGPLSRWWYAESRLQVRRSTSESVSSFEGPTVRVLDAFTSGGAQTAGGREATEVELATDIDYARRGHAMRMGALVEGGGYRSDARTNYFGTYTFPSLADYQAGRPATYTQRTGDPLVSYAQWQAGVYLQDDWRVRQNLTVSLGVRQEFQTHLSDRWNFGPRGGFTWSPFKSGKTTLRAGAGLFYDWLESETFEQTLRVDGSRQQDLVVVNPGYPDPFTGGFEQVLPPSKYMLSAGLVMPKRAMALFAVTQRLSSLVNVNASYNHQKGWDRFRGVNTNAPFNGVRPDTTLGNVTQVESTARLEQDSINLGLNFNIPQRRTFVFANYAWNNVRNDADGPFSLPANSYDLAAEWGRGGMVPRHIASALVNTTLMRNLRLGLSTSARSGTPYTITTGRDDNGDTVFNDRPAGTRRNSVTGAAMWDMAARLTYAFGFGERAAAGAAGPGGQMVMVRMGGGGAENKRVRLELFVAASNVLNNVNPMGYSGVMTSPFFGRATMAGPARKLDVGMKIGF